MNDFTKEELIEILNGMDDFYLAHSELKIGEKLQSMIDNYCDHEWKKGEHLFTNSYCIKCSKISP